MCCMVDEDWTTERGLNGKIRPITELLDGVQLEAIGNNAIPYKGYIILSVEFSKGDVVDVPFVVAKVKLRQPIIGTNLMEFLTKTYGEAQLRIALRQTNSSDFAAVSAVLMSENQSLSVVKSMHQRKAVKTVKAGQVQMIRCKINAISVDKDTPVLFQPHPLWNSEHTGIRLQESIVRLKAGVNNRIKITAINCSDKDFVFDDNDQLGTLEELDFVFPIEVEYKAFENTDCTNIIEAAGVSVGQTQKESNKNDSQSETCCPHRLWGLQGDEI